MEEPKAKEIQNGEAGAAKDNKASSWWRGAVQSGEDGRGTSAETVSLVRHRRQRSNWDCGLACVQMVLNAARTEGHRQQEQDEGEMVTAQELEARCSQDQVKRSVWTIDLCYLLRRYGVDFLFTTVTLGVDPSYAKEKFYARVLEGDSARVQERFEAAAAQGIRVEQSDASLEDILSHLRDRGPCIVLVNANLLSGPSANIAAFKVQNVLSRCCPGVGGSSSSSSKKGKDEADGGVTTSNSKKKSGSGNSLSGWRTSATFQGHYILATGFDEKERKVFYHNPSLGSGPSSIFFRQFDSARTSHGTDQDVIYVYL